MQYLNVLLEELNDGLERGCACIEFLQVSLMAEKGVVAGGMSGDERKGQGAAGDTSEVV